MVCWSSFSNCWKLGLRYSNLFVIFEWLIFDKPWSFCQDLYRSVQIRRECSTWELGSTLHGYLSKILARSCQDLGKTLAKILSRYWQELQDVIVRSYQESHVPKKTFIVKSYLEKKYERKPTKINISADLYC